MAVGLRIELSETALVAGPGGAATTRCTVYNASYIVDEYAVRIEGLDPSWIEAPPATSRIFPEATETLALVLKPPRTAGVAAGDYPFVVTATSADNPTLTASASGVLTVGPFVDWTLTLDSPRQARGETEGAWTLKIANTGNARIEVAVSAADEPRQLAYAVEDPTSVVDPGAARTVRLVARPKKVRLGAGAAHAIAVTATVTAVTPPAPLAPEVATRSLAVNFQQVAGTVDPPKLDPQRIELSGQSVQTRVLLTNKSAAPLTLALAAADPANALGFEFVGGLEATVPPGETSAITLRITALDRALLPPAPATVAFTVTATPTQPSGDPRSVQGELTQPSPADFRLRLEPETVEGTGPERVQLVIENVSGRGAAFTIAATSRDASLAVAVGSDRVEVPAHDRVSVPLTLTPQPDAIGPHPVPGARYAGYTARVAPSDAPARANEVSGQYVFTPATVTMRLARKEIESPGEAVYEVLLENGGKGEVTVALEASDRAGACAYAFDLPRLRLAARGTAPVRLTVTPPKDHPPDARWTFEVLAKPTSPAGAAVRDEGLLIYRAPTIGLTLSPPERRGRRTRAYDVVLSNPNPGEVAVRLSAVDRSGGLGVQLKRDTVQVPSAGRGSVKVPLAVTPWKRSKGSGEQALAFGVAATPISPPGDATTIEGRFVALPPRPRWFWILLLFALFVGLTFTPLYEQAFYVAGWKREIRRPDGTIWNGEHHVHTDLRCIFTTVRDDGPGSIRRECFEQGPRPEDRPQGVTGGLELRDRPESGHAHAPAYGSSGGHHAAEMETASAISDPIAGAGASPSGVNTQRLPGGWKKSSSA